MQTVALGYLRVSKKSHMDVVLFIPGRGRVMTYNHISEVAYVHASSLERPLVRLIEAQFDTTRLDGSTGRIRTTSTPSNLDAVAPAVASFHVPPLTLMKLVRATFLATVGYENVHLDSSFIARNYIVARSLTQTQDSHDEMFQMKIERNMAIEGNEDHGAEVMSYFVYSRNDFGEVGQVVAYGGNQDILVSAGHQNLYSSRMSATHLKHSIGSKNIGDVLRDVGGIKGFDWDKTIPLRKGQVAMAKELIWRFYAERSPVIGGNPIPTGRNIFYTSTTIESL
ncbi:hypothetical protein PBI_CANTARE_103 [Brevibacterium phage Cantare]|uniref:Uncharacterized protein n=1 Tax=Brevibacterium phage Cantare TaxID=2338395 RepID=A0A3G3LZQ4_9CAUD|nr:hypothetical protein PQD70_gp103 [Brevibacterium phage Cantare]AYQ99323.1 hypothetical protein PBI_CANTARE_103 [Brevibacterium phage Cantare]